MIHQRMPNHFSASKRERENDAHRRGKHERKKGFDKGMNPYVHTNLDHEPNLYENWLRGWKEMDKKIEKGVAEEYN